MANTTFADPTDFQDAGEDCESCRRFWESQDLPPMEMIYLRDNEGNIIATEVKGVPIVVCPRCDGDLILRLHKE